MPKKPQKSEPQTVAESTPPIDRVAERLYDKICQLDGLDSPLRFSELDDDRKDYYRAGVKAIFADADSVKALATARGVVV